MIIKTIGLRLKNPYNGIGSKTLFTIDDIWGPIILKVGEVYRFVYTTTKSENYCEHPFYFSYSCIGAGAEPISIQLCQGEYFDVTLDERAINGPPIYYQCGHHEYMGERVFVAPNYQ